MIYVSDNDTEMKNDIQATLIKSTNNWYILPYLCILVTNQFESVKLLKVMDSYRNKLGSTRVRFEHTALTPKPTSMTLMLKCPRCNSPLNSDLEIGSPQRGPVFEK